jgi:hypothetical protein
MKFEVDTRIPYGNACELSLNVSGDTLEVSFAPDPHGGPETLWFCFRLRRVDQIAADPGMATGEVQGVHLVLKHSYNMLGGQDPLAMRPVVRYDTGEWRRLPEGRLLPQPDGRMEVVWDVAAPKRHVDVATCYPYGMEEVHALVAEMGDAWRIDTIGVSQSARSLIRLSNDYGQEGGNRPGLYLIARQHSGETPGSWVLDGFLRHLSALGAEAPLIWAVPLANIDGIEGGDYGKDNFPYDLNRAWGRPPMRHEVSVYQRDIWRWRSRCNAVVAVDFHAPGACETGGVYAYVPDPDVARGAHKVMHRWADWTGEALAHPLPDPHPSGEGRKPSPRYAAEPFARVARYPSRWETPSFRDYLWSQLGVPSITFETPYAMVGQHVLTQADYREIGRRLAVGVMHGIEASSLGN